LIASLVFNANFSSVSAISWRSSLMIANMYMYIIYIYIHTGDTNETEIANTSGISSMNKLLFFYPFIT
jgi:hypothetical protein